MAVKNNVLQILEYNKGKIISGTEIAKKLNVSRNAVWKAINLLKNDGYKIESVYNKGYVLLNNNNILSVESIKKYLKFPAKIEVLETVDSTNNYLKNLANSGTEGTVVVAKQQTGGKGRLGRSFFSPDNSGVYFSILLKPKISIEKSVLITTAAAVSVAEAIDEISGNTSQIKWVNDVFVNNKKVCGILTEASFDLESQGLQFAVLGIGINVFKPKQDFPEDIKATAGAVFKEREISSDIKSKIITKVIDKFFDYYKTLEELKFLDIYRKKSLITGKNIFVIKNGTKIKAKALRITDSCGLEVEYEDGKSEILNSGEVSVREIV